MKTIIDLANWNRREHFEFFSKKDEPYHGLVVNIDCTWAYRYCKEKQWSFFLFYLHRVLHAINKVDAMRYRITDGQVVDFHSIHANATVQRADHTFGFCPIFFDPDFERFVSQAQQAMQKVKDSMGLCFNEDCARPDVIHFSALPWMSFTGLTHARQLDGLDSVPKISVGKYFWQNDKLMMPVACFVHHGLVDGYHVHQFLQALEQMLAADTYTSD